MDSFIKLDKFNHKAIVGASNSSSFFDKALSLFIIISLCEYEICYYKSDGSRYTLNAMYQNFPPISKRVIHKVNHFIKQTLYILILWILQEKSKIIVLRNWTIFLIFHIFKPIQTIISSTVHNISNLIFF